MAKPMSIETLGLVAGAEIEKTFSDPATGVAITTDKFLYIAPTSAALAIQADGGEGERVTIPAGTVAKFVPWTGDKIHIKNADTTDSVRILVEGVR
jgi:hypothetical protein